MIATHDEVQFTLDTADGTISFTRPATEVQRINGQRITRRQVEFADGSTGRVYITEDGNVYPSVSTLIDLRDTDKTALTRWKERYDGSLENNRAHWRDILNFKASFGTLAHYEVLNPLADNELWGEEEEAATSAFDNSFVPFPVDELGEYARDPMFEGEGVFVERDGLATYLLDWVEGHASNVFADLDHAVDVETYLVNEELGYAGQVDLVYVSNLPHLDIVVCDVKTSKQVRYKHKLQSAAYGIAYQQMRGVDVDELKVARLSPFADEGDRVEGSYSFQWEKPSSPWNEPVTRDELEERVAVLAERFDEEKRPIQGLAEQER